nr:PAS domain-containing protein [Pseudomonas subflava]
MPAQTVPTPMPEESLDFLSNGGAIGALMQTLDWAQSPLGAPSSWSLGLKNLVATMLPVEAQIVMFWGPEFVALYNDAYAPSIGAKHPQALGRPAVENWRELWDDLEPLLRGVYETGRTFSAKDRPFYIERHGVGETVYFDVSYSAVRETDGSIGGVLCVVNETTERVQFERRQAFLLDLGQALPLSKAPDQILDVALHRLGDILGASRVFYGEDNGDGVSFTVRQDHVRDVRSAVGVYRYRDFGIRLLKSLREDQIVIREDLAAEPGRSVGETALSDELAIAAALHIPVVRHGALEAVLAVHYDQPRHFTEHELRLAEDAAKLAWSAIGHARAEAALRASSAQLSAMFDQASAGIAVCDRHWRFTRVNDRYCEIVGRPREALLGLRMHDITYPDDLSTHASQCELTLEGGAPYEVTKRYARPDGTPVWVQNQITPLVDPLGNTAGMLCVCMDVSARVRAEVELRELNEGLEERVAAMVAQREAAVAQLHEVRKMETIGQLTGGIAHDFNNLLTPIMGALELIRRRLDDERSRNLIDGALQAADRARTLVGRLLTFARRQTLKPQAVELNALVGDMRDLIARSLEPMIEVAVEIPGNLPSVMVDPHQLELAILNLAVNARDAMEDGGRLEIAAAFEEVAEGAVNGLEAGRYARLIVSDNGSGMDAITLERCAEPFFSTKGVGRGTGLGLSMVQGLAAQSGGGLGIASEPGRGTRVSIWLPATEAPAEHEGEDSADAPLAPRPTQVLLVDDEDMVRHTTLLQLHDLGYQVAEAPSAAAALRMIDEGLKPDVLVTDHIMAEKTGAQLAQELRQRMPELPVLIITGYANLSPAQIDGFEVLAKPFRRTELAAHLSQMVNPTS